MKMIRYIDCEKVFAHELAKTIDAIVSSELNLSKDEKVKLVKSIAFGVAAHVSGSSFGGRVNDQEVYPILNYCIGEGDNSEYMEGSSSLHESITASLTENYEKP